MTKLQTELDSLDSVDESVRSFYVEKEGKFVLDVEIPDVAGLKSALEKERLAVKTEKLARKHDLEKYTGIDPDKYAELVAAHDEAERVKAEKSGDISKIVEAQTKKAIDASNQKLADAMAAADSANKRAQAYEGRVLDDAIRAAAASAGLHPSAVDDALFRARTMFSLDENGMAVQRDADGNVVKGADGVTPYNPGEWLDSMREKAPHWFPAVSTGTGSGQRVNGVVPSGQTKKDWSTKQKSEYIEKHGRKAYETLPY